jgi:hypothetical protein
MAIQISDKITASDITTALNGKADKIHSHTKSQIIDFPTSMPANGGYADSAGYASSAGYANSAGSATFSITYVLHDSGEHSWDCDLRNKNLPALVFWQKTKTSSDKHALDIMTSRNAIAISFREDSTDWGECIGFRYVRANNWTPLHSRSGKINLYALVLPI